MKDLSLLVTSCYSFSDMWDNNLALLHKFFKDDSSITLITDKCDVCHKEKHPEIVEISGEMSERLLLALENIRTKYVLIVFDDNYLVKPANLELLSEIINYMDQNSISYCGTYRNIKNGNEEKAGKLRFVKSKLSETYEVNFYPSIWKKEDLIKCLDKNEDIWKSEVYLTRRLKQNGMKGIIALNKDTFKILDVVRKGKYIRKASRYIKRNELFLSDRPIRTRKEEFVDDVTFFISMHMPKCFKNALKNLGRKKGRTYLSDAVKD